MSTISPAITDLFTCYLLESMTPSGVVRFAFEKHWVPQDSLGRLADVHAVEVAQDDEAAWAALSES